MLIVLLSIFLRTFNLDKESLWLDEGGSVRLARLSPPRLLEETAGNFHPPFYFLLLHGWIALAGDSEFSVRFPSVLFGVFAVLVIYLVGRALFDDHTGALAALLLALSRFHVYYSQEARMYALLALLALLSMYFFIRLSRSTGLADRGFYLFFSALLLYTHNVGVFIIAAQNIYWLGLWLFRRPARMSGRLWLFLQFLLIILYLPWLGVVLEQVARIRGPVWRVPRPSLETLWHTLLNFSGTRSLRWILIACSLAAVITLKRPGRSGRARSVRDYLGNSRWAVRIRTFDETLLLCLWLLVPILAPFAISQWTAPIYLHKAVIGAAPAFYLLAARGILCIPWKWPRRLGIVMPVVFFLLSARQHYRQVFRDQWRSAAQLIARTAADGDLLVFDPPSPADDVFSYYLPRTGLLNRRVQIWKVDPKPQDMEQFLARVRGYDRVWFILSHRSLAKSGAIREAMETAYRLIRHREYFNRANVPFHGYRIGLEVLLFEKLPPRTVLPGEDIDRFARAGRSISGSASSGWTMSFSSPSLD